MVSRLGRIPRRIRRAALSQVGLDDSAGRRSLRQAWQEVDEARDHEAGHSRRHIGVELRWRKRSVGEEFVRIGAGLPVKNGREGFLGGKEVPPSSGWAR